MPELKTVLPNACLRRGYGRQADFVIEGYVDPREPRGIRCDSRLEAAGRDIPRGEPLRGEGFKRPWPPLIKMDETVRRKIAALFGG